MKTTTKTLVLVFALAPLLLSCGKTKEKTGAIRWLSRSSAKAPWQGQQTTQKQAIKHIREGIRGVLYRPLKGKARPKKEKLPPLAHILIVERPKGKEVMRLEIFGNAFVRHKKEYYAAQRLLIILGLLRHRDAFTPMNNEALTPFLPKKQ